MTLANFYTVESGLDELMLFHLETYCGHEKSLLAPLGVHILVLDLSNSCKETRTLRNFMFLIISVIFLWINGVDNVSYNNSLLVQESNSLFYNNL